MPTKRDQIEAVASQYGWTVERGRRSMYMTRQPEPDAPLGGPRLVVRVAFQDFSPKERVSYAEYGTGRLTTQLAGGVEAIKRHLRQHGEKQ